MKKQADRYGILKHATKQMVNITFLKDIKKGKCEVALSALDKEYEAVLREMLTYIRQQVNGSEVKTAHDLLVVFRDSCHAIGGIMTRAELIAKPLVRKLETASDRAAFKNAIIEQDCSTKGFDDFDDWISGDSDCTIANDTAYSAYYYADDVWENAEIFATLPFLEYLEKNKLTKRYINMGNIFWENDSCVPAVIKNVPIWAKRHPLLGYVGKWEDEDDGINPPRRMRGIEEIEHYKVKINTHFVKIFVDRLMQFYDANDINNPEFYTVMELRRITHKRVFAEFAEDCRFDTPHILQGLRWLLDTADKTGGVIPEDASENVNFRTAPLSNDAVVYRDTMRSGITYTLNKDGLSLLVDIVEALRIADVLPGFDGIANRIRSLA